MLAPYLIRPGKPYNVAIRRWGITKSIVVTITISGTKQDGTTITPIVTTSTISTSVSGTFVTVNTATLVRGTYFLTVSGDGYTDKRALTYATKSSSIVLQINKSFYKPEQTVQFRLYAFNSETNAVNEACQITVNDPRENVIRSYTKVGLIKGKFQDVFDLASNPPLGYWYLEARCGQEVK